MSPALAGTLVFIMCLTAPRGLAGKAQGVDSENKVSIAAALAAMGDVAPICRLAPTDSATETDMICPPGTEEDDNNPYCYQPCALMDAPASGVRYVTSTQNDDHCLPVCTNGTTRWSSTNQVVKCIVSCPTGYSAVKDKGCYSNCPAGLPVQWNSTTPACTTSCPSYAPIAVSASRCKNANGTTWATRVIKLRSSVTPTKSASWNVKPKVEVEMVCPAGADQYVTYNEDNPEQANSGCYKCDADYKTAIDGNWVYCAPATCPSGYKRCANFCWFNLLPLAGLSQDDCTALMEVLPCVDSCYSDGERRRRLE